MAEALRKALENLFVKDRTIETIMEKLNDLDESKKKKGIQSAKRILRDKSLDFFHLYQKKKGIPLLQKKPDAKPGTASGSSGGYGPGNKAYKTATNSMALALTALERAIAELEEELPGGDDLDNDSDED